MLDLFAGSLATLITVPLLAWVIVYWFMKMITGKKKISFLFAVDVTTFFLIGSVLSIFYTIWDRFFIWPVAVVLIVIVMFITWLYWKQGKDVTMNRILKTSWRFNFLLFFSSYLVLTVYGVIARILSIAS
jgi:uncharacterized membrane protein YcaP (DUF421 family)